MFSKNNGIYVVFECREHSTQIFILNAQTGEYLQTKHVDTLYKQIIQVDSDYFALLNNGKLEQVNTIAIPQKRSVSQIVLSCASGQGYISGACRTCSAGTYANTISSSTLFLSFNDLLNPPGFATGCTGTGCKYWVYSNSQLSSANNVPLVSSTLQYIATIAAGTKIYFEYMLTGSYGSFLVNSAVANNFVVSSSAYTGFELSLIHI